MMERIAGVDFSGIKIYDTLVLTRMFESDVKERYDYERVEKDKKDKKKSDPTFFGGALIGSHKLEAWALRLGMKKDEYSDKMKAKGLDPWAEWNEDMEAYAHVDVDVTVALWEYLSNRVDNPQYTDAIQLEQNLQDIMSKLERDGVYFDTPLAKSLISEMEDAKPDVIADIQKAFPKRHMPLKWIASKYIGNGDEESKLYKSWARNFDQSIYPYLRYMRELPEEMGDVFTPKVESYDKLNECKRVKHASYCKMHYADMNPKSRKQVVRRLKAIGWEPREFTPAGNPKLNADVLEVLGETVPAASQLARLYLLDKRMEQVATGKEAWLKHVDPNGFIHPRINPCGTITMRGAHSSPNISQVPALKYGTVDGENVILKGEPGGWGYECRACFTTPPLTMTSGVVWKQVGSDLSGLELRCFGHYLYPYDDGEFIDRLQTSDVHGYNQEVMGLANRTDAKRVIFLLLYGGGDEHLGKMLHPEFTSAQAIRFGRSIRNKLMNGIKGFKRLTNKYQREAESNGYVTIIDGRRVPVRNAYAALNTLLQSTGSILAKKWIDVLINRYLNDKYNLIRGYAGDYVLTVWSHDEVQFVCKEEHAKLIAKACNDASLEAGEMLNFRAKLESESMIGLNWAECH